MKKFLAILLALIMVLSLAACGGTPSDTASDNTNDNPNGSNNQTQSDSDNSEKTNEESTQQIQESLGIVDLSAMLAGECIDPNRKSTANTDERYPLVVTFTQSEITTWTPWQTSQGRDQCIHWLWEPLFFYLDGYELQPVLAKDWYEEDDTHFVVEIYDYIHDTDGNNITAEDVVASFEALVNSGNANDFAFYESCEAIDTYTVRFTWNEKITTLSSLAVMMETAIFSQKANEDHDFTTDPVGTGPYKLTGLVTGSKYTFEANDDYWQTDESLASPSSKRNVQTIEIEVLEDSTMAYVAFEEGSIFNCKPNTTQLPDFFEGGKYAGQYTIVSEFGAGVNGIGFNMSGESVMDDINMRLAVAYAIDSQGIIEAMGDSTFYALHAESGEAMPGFQEEWLTLDNYYNTYDKDLAKEYLAKTSYNGETLILLTNPDENTKLAAQIIQQELGEIGINCELSVLDNAIIKQYLYDVTYWDLFMYSWNGDYIAQLWGRQSDMRNYSHGYTETGINDPVFQDMIERVQTVDEYGPELVNELQTYITENCLLYGIFSTCSYNVYNPDLASIVANHAHKDYMLGACDYYLD